MTIRAICFWAAWWLAGVAWGAPYVEERTGLIFPEHCGGWERTGERVYPEKELGISVSYTNEQQKTLTAYVYTGGIEDLPSGADSDLMLQLTTQTADELKQVWQERGGEVEEILPSAVIREEPSGRGLATIVAHRIEMNGQVLITISALTGYRGSVLKVRYTYARSPLDEGIADLKRFAFALLAANREKLDSAFAELAAEYAAVKEPVPTRDEVLAAMAVLENDIAGAEAGAAAKTVIRFVEGSEDVVVTLGREVAPWVMDVDENDTKAQEASALLLAVYLGANARSQLASGRRENDVFAGWKAVVSAYRKLRDTGTGAIAAMEELAKAEERGELEGRAREAEAELDRSAEAAEK